MSDRYTTTSASTALDASLTAALLMLAACAGPSSESEPRLRGTRPNIVLVMADDLGWGELGMRGHPFVRTPELDTMAAEGLSLERFYAAAPVCTPTRASVLTGRHPVRLACLAWGHYLPPGEVTLAELARDAGYATGHFGKWHLGSVRAGAPTSPGAQGFETWLSVPNFYDLDPLMSDGGVVVETRGEGSELTVDAALDFIRAADAARRPFLAVVWFGSPHLPHHALDEDLAAFADVPEELRAYCAEIAALDRSLGHLRDELERLGIADETLVWFTSDNGPRPPNEGDDDDASTAGLRGRKGSLWEGGIRVPSFIVWPVAIRSPGTSTTPSGTVDVLPTVAALMGAPLPGGVTLDGTSLLPLFGDGSGDETRARPLGFWSAPAKGRGVHSDRVLAGLRDGRAELDVAPFPDDAFPTPERLAELPGRAAWIESGYKLHAIPRDGRVDLELYDLDADPDERANRAGAHPERLAQMFARLQAWQTSAVSDYARARVDVPD